MTARRKQERKNGSGEQRRDAERVVRVRLVVTGAVVEGRGIITPTRVLVSVGELLAKVLAETGMPWIKRETAGGEGQP